MQFDNGGVINITQTAASFGVATLTSVPEGANLRLTLGVTGDATGANFVIQSSQDLMNWSNTSTMLNVGGTTTVPTTSANLFYRAYRP